MTICSKNLTKIKPIGGIRYHISKQRDIAVEIQGQQRFRMLKEQVEAQMLEDEQRQQANEHQQQMAPASPEQLPERRLLDELESAIQATMAEAADIEGRHQPDTTTMPSLDSGE
jgi:hypothetical protein